MQLNGVVVVDSDLALLLNEIRGVRSDSIATTQAVRSEALTCANGVQRNLDSHEEENRRTFGELRDLVQQGIGAIKTIKVIMAVVGFIQVVIAIYISLHARP